MSILSILMHLGLSLFLGSLESGEPWNPASRLTTSNSGNPDPCQALWTWRLLHVNWTALFWCCLPYVYSLYSASTTTTTTTGVLGTWMSLTLHSPQEKYSIFRQKWVGLVLTIFSLVRTDSRLSRLRNNARGSCTRRWNPFCKLCSQGPRLTRQINNTIQGCITCCGVWTP